MRSLLSIIACLSITAASAQDIKPVLMPNPPDYKQDKPSGFVDEPAQFPGGMAAFNKFLKDNLVYPQSAIDQGLEGKAFLRFVVSETGEISDITIARGVPGCPECDSEAKRLMKIMPKWNPGKNQGKPVKSSNTVPVTFKLQ
jgi:periplasmic protein TonB